MTVSLHKVTQGVVLQLGPGLGQGQGQGLEDQTLTPHCHLTHNIDISLSEDCRHQRFKP